MGLQLDPWLKQLSITDKRARSTLLDPNWTPAQRRVVDEVQRAYDEKRPCRIINLKARQLGISTISLGLGFTWTTIFPNITSFVVAHTSQATLYLFDKTRQFYDNWVLKDQFPTRYASRREIVFKNNNSSIRVQTARNPEALHGRTINFFHGSEVSRWERQEESMIAIQYAVPNRPGTVMILESTANGMGDWFERTWHESEAGLNDYIPIFAPWFTHHEYIPCQGDECRDGTCDICTKASKIRPQDDEEKRLIGLGCDLAHVAWRRWAIPNLAFGSQDWFREQMPSTSEEAFLTSGVRVFPEIWLTQIYEKAKPAVGRLTKEGFVNDPRGPLRVYKPPSDDAHWGQYYIGADSAHGVVDGDYAAAQVINRQTKEQVATWHGRINPYAFADELVKLGNWYNQAVIACESSGPGQSTLGRLIGLYPRLWHQRLVDRTPGHQRSEVMVGFSMNWQRKQWLITQLADAVERQDILIHDRATFDEMRSYSFYGDKGDVYGPTDKARSNKDLYDPTKHDDLLMALGIAVVCERVESPVPPYEMRPGARSKDQKVIFGESVSMEELIGEEWSA